MIWALRRLSENRSNDAHRAEPNTLSAIALRRDHGKWLKGMRSLFAALITTRCRTLGRKVAAFLAEPQYAKSPQIWGRPTGGPRFVSLEVEDAPHYWSTLRGHDALNCGQRGRRTSASERRGLRHKHNRLFGQPWAGDPYDRKDPGR
jgi:hypothetical protein